MSCEWNFFLKENVFFGEGSISGLAVEIARMKLGRGLLVIDPVLQKIGAGEKCLALLEEKGIKCSVFAEVEPNPHLSTILRAFTLYRQDNCSFVIGLGGGSSLDAAKAVAVMSTNPEPYASYAGDERFHIPPAPIFAIPTTAGTGSEVTGSAVVVNDLDGGHSKLSIRSPLQTPQSVVLDPSFLYTLPPSVIANSGLDALSHALESYVSTASTPMTRVFSRAALSMIARNLYAFYKDPHNSEAAGNMLLASHLAGIAFTRAKLGVAHVIANGLEPYIKMPHGAACALATPAVMRFTREAAREKYADVARCFLEAEGNVQKAMSLNTEELSLLAADCVEKFINGLGVATKLKSVELSKETIEGVAKAGFPAAHCKVSPVIPTVQELQNLIISLLQ